MCIRVTMHVSASRTVTPQGTASAIAGLAVTLPQRAPPQPPPAQFSSAQPSRMAPSLEEISALPKLKLTKPPRSCEDELRRPELGAVVAGMDDMLEDVGFKVGVRVRVRVRLRVRVTVRVRVRVLYVAIIGMELAVV